MDRVRNQNEIQFTLEEDRNIPDAKPDASMVISDMGEVTLEEIRPVTDQVNVRGKLQYQILYASPEEKVPQVITGEIPFEEQYTLSCRILPPALSIPERSAFKALSS